MEDQEKTFDTICRVCLRHDTPEEMVSLIENCDESLSPYGLALGSVIKSSVLQNQYLPTKICSKCKRFLEEIAGFKARCENSTEKLSKVIDFGIKQELTDGLVKEVIRQYSLFNQNHPDEEKVNDICTLNYEHSKSLKIKGEYSNIKVEVDIQNLTRNETTKTDNVDVFLYSIHKLLYLSSKIDEKAPKKEKVKHKPTEEDLTCKLCQRVLANPLTFKHHMQRHGKCPYVCDQCGKGFPVLAELTKHQIYRHGYGSALECDVCSFKAARKFELIEHVRLHTGERPFTCEKCGLTFRRKAIYKNHLSFHGEKKVQCEQCPKMFFRKSHMLLHMNSIHDRQYVYQCHICKITYAMVRTVRKHLVDKHGIPKEMQGKIVRIDKNMDATYFEDKDADLTDL